MSRLKITSYNTLFSFSYELLVFAIGLIMPKLIISVYGSEVNGLTATVTQIINIINLLQAGALGASIFAMYKPVAEKDYSMISTILDSSRRYYRKLGVIFLLLILVVAIVLPILKVDSTIKMGEMFLSVLILGINGSFLFFFYSSYNIVFSSHQKNYILSIACSAEKIVYFLLMFAVISLHIHFVFMYVAVLVGSVLRLTLLEIKYKKEFGNKITKLESNDYSVPNKSYLLVTQLSLQLISASPLLVISFLFGLKEASVYSIYALVMNALILIINTIQLSISPVFGNVVVTESEKKSTMIFGMLEFVFRMLSMFLVICSSFLFMPFIKIYTSGFSDTNYIIDLLPLLMLLCVLSFTFYLVYSLLLNVKGYYKETYKVDLILSITGVVFSILMSYRFGMQFVLVGVFIYYLTAAICRIRVIAKRGIIINKQNLIIRWSVALMFLIGSYSIQRRIVIDVDNFLIWTVYAVIIAIMTILILFIYSLVFERTNLGILRGYIIKK